MINNKEQIVEQAIELRKQGLTVRKIADRLDASYGTVQRALRDMNAERKAAFIERFKELRFGKRRHALRDICRELHISIDLARYWEAKLGGNN